MQQEMLENIQLAARRMLIGSDDAIAKRFQRLEYEERNSGRVRKN